MQDVVKNFEKIFEVSLDGITGEQWFKLSFIARGKMRDMYVCNNLKEYKYGILDELVRWYKEMTCSDNVFADADWAEEVKEEIQEVLS